MEKFRKIISMLVSIIVACIGLYLVVLFFVALSVTGFVGIIYFLIPAVFLFWISYKSFKKDFQKNNV